MNKMDTTTESSIEKLYKQSLPPQLLELPDAPMHLYCQGTLPQDVSYITVVGSRKPSSYGRDVCESIISGLAGYPVAIVSGLALGIDALAHKTALKHGIPTVAVPGSGIDERVLYPRSNLSLSKEIIKAGGVLLSEYEPHERAQKYMFPKRNRIMAGLSDIILVIEAREKSGSLITAYLGLDYNRTICAVPGSIYSPNSVGTNKLLKEGAAPITCSEDILDVLGIEKTDSEPILEDVLSQDELYIVKSISEEITYDELFETVSLPSHVLNSLLSQLEMKGLIKNENGLVRRV